MMWLRAKWWLYRKIGWAAHLRLRKGHVFHGPDGMGYKVTRHIYSGDTMFKTDLKPLGGAPDIEEPYSSPQWLKDQMRDIERRDR